MPPHLTAIGSSNRAATPVRRKTSVAGVSSPTAMRMNRYGMPHMRLIAAKSSTPRRVISLTVAM